MPESEALTVFRLAADDWRAYRAIRLAMLQESPMAFGSTYDDTASFDEQLWMQRLTDNVVFLARVGRVPAGSVVFSEHGVTEAGDCSLFGMWVDPAFRQTGVGRALVQAVVAQTRAAGKRRVVLHVVGDNSAAMALYEREGFVATGRSVPYPNDGHLMEIEMGIMLE